MQTRGLHLRANAEYIVPSYMTEITFDEFKKAEIRIGTILSAEKVPDADKLIKLMINTGDESPRQILSGIAEHYPDTSVLVGKQVPVLANLPTRTIRGIESQGMVLYAVGDGFLTTIEPSREIPPGTNVQ
ncbi:MAG: Methionine-tRNA ligase [Parcubacteria group bacterium GW2011_GWC1_42_11]|uniref:Methionine--tRNA ligase n=1 Tax=Candidatus Nomurabacteria bacterium GW2011_GWC2_42_20 TaxID=1618756 RepID=A0A0G0ZEU1_9BACT|nr:MAG: Methionine-tRNA ligase [Parcubacteria group bacterium GW2011_GWC1_42_11]KKS47217.1 MAG: Methionine-tRNA ligase [Candidatus Nomurabacteria bacterium GW2011_GWC2_42_20]KKS58607.1 MAG: Methionine-tRNA ligase [Candidatus Nomurabacteria bacterium GW2011_GWA2_42_41]KKT08305.1 MAG: Methionine-tRNA ligase [Candidatus Nomurabacteria bacterium GW2011_GWB1_43_20]HBH71749.1 hypothetical protein [Candidatus Yonathbacteria bacterium]